MKPFLEISAAGQFVKIHHKDGNDAILFIETITPTPAGPKQ
jgi:hypothetical protein